MKKTNGILITGWSGFLGIHILPKLRQRKKAKIILFKGNILDRSLIQKTVQGVDTVIHLAAKTRLSEKQELISSLIETNVLGTKVLLDAALKNNVQKFIFFSTSGVYGEKIIGRVMDENHPTNPLNPYTASKLAAETVAQSFFNGYNLPVVILRITNVYGPNQSPDWMMPLFISKLLQNQPIVLNHLGRPRRDWIYVEDVVRAVELIINAPVEKIKGEVFNLGIGKSISNLEVAQSIAKELGVDFRLIKLVKSGKRESKSNMAVSRKIFENLGWKPIYSFKEGLRETIRWYRENEKLAREKKDKMKIVNPEIV